MSVQHPSAGFALCAVVLIAAACATSQEVTAPVTVQAEPSATPSLTSPTPTETAAPTESANASPTVPAEQTVEVSRPVPFTITVPGDWEEDEALVSGTTFTFKSGVDRWVVFTELGADTVEEWIAELTSGDRLTATTPEPIDLDGAPGFVVDIEPTEGEVVLFEEATLGTWSVEPERPSRVWVVESPGGTVLIVTDAPTRAFDGWVEVVDPAIQTIDWEE